jgi:hypothetical protein
VSKRRQRTKAKLVPVLQTVEDEEVVRPDLSGETPLVDLGDHHRNDGLLRDLDLHGSPPFPVALAWNGGGFTS